MGFWSFYRDSLVDMFELTGLRGWSGKILFFLLGATPILVFCLLIRSFDRNISRIGLAKASRILLKKFYQGSRSSGAPVREGPVLFLAHHPGIVDSLGLFSHLGQSELRSVVSDRYFFRGLRSLSQSFLYVETTRPSPSLIKNMLQVLRQGQSLLLYPAGTIEDDPNLLEKGTAFLGSWSASPVLLSRLAQKEGWDFLVQPVLVSGIFEPADLSLPWVRKGQTRREKERRSILAIVFGRIAKKRRIQVDFAPSQWASDCLGKDDFPETYQRRLESWYWDKRNSSKP